MSDSDEPEQRKKSRLQPRNFGKTRNSEADDSKKLKLDQSRRTDLPKPPSEKPSPSPSLREPGKPAPPTGSQKPAKAEFFINPGRGGVPLFKEELQRKLEREQLIEKIGTKRNVLIALAALIVVGTAALWAVKQSPTVPVDTANTSAGDVTEPLLDAVQPSPSLELGEISPMAAVQAKLAPYLGRLEALQAGGNRSEIEKVYRDAAAETSNLPLFWLRMGILYYTYLRSAGDTNAEILEKANPFFERAMRFGTELPVVLSHASTYFVETGQIDAGLTALKRLAELRPTDPGVLQQLAFTQTATGKKEEAISTIQQMIAINPGDVRTRLAYANLLEETGRIEDAAEAYRIYLALNPEDVGAILRNSQMLRSQGRPEAAKGVLERAILSHPEDFNLQANYAILLLETKNYERALEVFDTAEQLLPEDIPPGLMASLLMGMGSAFYELGELDNAEKLFEQAFRLVPEGNPDASNNLAYLWARKSKNLEEAARMAGLNVQEAPENPSYRHTLALTLFRQGQSNAALEQLEVALEKSEEPTGALLETIGDVHASLGANGEAQKFYARALAKAPDDEELRAKVTE